MWPQASLGEWTTLPAVPALDGVYLGGLIA